MKNFIITVLVLLFVVFAIQAQGYTDTVKMKKIESNSYLAVGAWDGALYTLLVEILKELNDIERAIHRGRKLDPTIDSKGANYPNKAQ